MKGIKRLALCATVAALAATVGATKAEAGLLTCGESPEYPFAPWGDRAPYSLAPNGGLESGATGWTLRGARVVAGNNAFTRGSYSLWLPSGASASSPAACVKLADPASRFFLKGASGTGRVRVDVEYRTLLGLLPVTTNLGYATAGGAWQPSPKYSHVLANVLGTLRLSGLYASLNFKFTAVGGNFQVDDLFVDPLITI